MKKTTSSKYPANLPISRNAYKRFINRIISVFADDPAGMSEMITAFDSYLTDPASPIIFINPSMRVAFSFLRQDIDIAIERSRRARQRALARKASTTPSTTPSTTNDTITETSTTPEGTTTHIPATPPKGTISPAHVPATTPKATTSSEIETPTSTNPEKESPSTTTHKQETSTTPTVTKKTSPAPHHHRKNTRNTSTSHPSRHTTRKRKLKFNKPGQ